MGIPKETLVYYYLAEWHSGSYNGLRLALHYQAEPGFLSLALL